MPVTHLTDSELLQLASAFRDSLPSISTDGQRIAVGLYRLLAEGNPVSEQRLIASTGLPAHVVADTLASWPGVYRNDAGEVIGFQGLAVGEMPPHAFHFNGRRLSAWCAWDSLFLPVLLGQTARVESVCAVTGDPVAATVGPHGVTEAAPDGVVMSLLRPDGDFDGDIIRSFCHHVVFFRSAEVGDAWIANRTDAFLLSLDQGFELGRQVFGVRYAAVIENGSPITPATRQRRA